MIFFSKGTSHLMAVRPAARIAASALALLMALWGLGVGCNWRKPLSQAVDAGPAIRLKDPSDRPLGAGTSGLGRPGDPSGAVLALPAGVVGVEEHEPNDDREHAQPLVVGTAVRGSLAAPTELGAGKGADDLYLLTEQAGGPKQQLALHLQGGPLADVRMDVYDATPTVMGAPLAEIDAAGRGGAEQSLGWVMRAGHSLLVRVRGNAPAKERADLAYILSVTATAAPPGSELEPNNTVEQATLVESSSLSGSIAGTRDEDVWELRPADGLYRRPSTKEGSAQPLKTEAILRLELRLPGQRPRLTVVAQEAAPAPGTQGGETPPVPNGQEPGTAGTEEPGQRKVLVDAAAGEGAQELMLRNVGLAVGTSRVWLKISSLGRTGKGPSEGRYLLDARVEPPLDGAEHEPNDDCATASVLTLSMVGGSGVQGQMAGFLWPGDRDCYRIVHNGSQTPLLAWAKLALPGRDCDGGLVWVESPEAARLPTPAATEDPDTKDGKKPATGSKKSPPAEPNKLLLQFNRQALLRVVSRTGKGCGPSPYQLVVEQAERSPRP